MQLKKRIARLEGSKPGDLTMRQVMLDGTPEDVARQRAEAVDSVGPGEGVVFRAVVPNVGESMNDYRERQGMARLDVEGWDTPREADGA